MDMRMVMQRLLVDCSFSLVALKNWVILNLCGRFLVLIKYSLCLRNIAKVFHRHSRKVEVFEMKYSMGPNSAIDNQTATQTWKFLNKFLETFQLAYSFETCWSIRFSKHLNSFWCLWTWIINSFDTKNELTIVPVALCCWYIGTFNKFPFLKFLLKSNLCIGMFCKM